MKKLGFAFCILLVAFLLPDYVAAQHDDILVETDMFDFLIGEEYVDVKELGNFEKGACGYRTDSTGISRGICKIFVDTLTIILSVHERYEIGLGDVREILDLIVLNKESRTCGGCLLANELGQRILTLHPVGAPRNRESVLLTYSIDYESGKMTRVDQWEFEVNKRAFYP